LQQHDLLYITNFRCILPAEIATYVRLKSRESCSRKGIFRSYQTKKGVINNSRYYF
jgi:hypothetical protein